VARKTLPREMEILRCTWPWSTVRRECDKDPKDCEREYVCRSKSLGHFWEKAKKSGTVHNMFEEGQGHATRSRSSSP